MVRRGRTPSPKGRDSKTSDTKEQPSMNVYITNTYCQLVSNVNTHADLWIQSFAINLILYLFGWLIGYITVRESFSQNHLHVFFREIYLLCLVILIIKRWFVSNYMNKEKNYRHQIPLMIAYMATQMRFVIIFIGELFRSSSISILSMVYIVTIIFATQSVMIDISTPKYMAELVKNRMKN